MGLFRRPTCCGTRPIVSGAGVQLETLTLRFVERGIERGYIASRSKHLVRNFGIAAGLLCLFAACCLSLVLADHRTPYQLEGDTEEHRHIKDEVWRWQVAFFSCLGIFAVFAGGGIYLMQCNKQ